MTQPAPYLSPEPTFTEVDYSHPDLRAFLAAPNLLTRLNAAVRANQIDPRAASIIARDLNLHIRAEKGERTRPRLYNGALDPSYPKDPGFAFPHTPRQEHRPDRTDPNSPARQALEAAKSSLETEEIQRGLAARMGADTTPPPETAWDRLGPASEAIERRTPPAYRDAAATPSLHETISSAVRVLGS